MSDEELQERVCAVVCDSSSDAGSGSHFHEWAPFMTQEMLRRLHNAVASFMPERGEGCKQSALSRVLANVRGARPRFHSRDEYEYPANAIETVTYQLSEVVTSSEESGEEECCKIQIQRK